MRVIVVTAADEMYFPLLQGLLQSLYQWKRRPFTDVGVLDLGLARDSKAWVAKAARHIVAPVWDLPVTGELRHTKAVWRAMTARPFLPRYFPGYDIYVWLDADTWVQERLVIETCIAVAAEGRLAVAIEHHPAYVTPPEILEWRQQMIEWYFGENARKDGRWDIYANSGVLGLRGDAPHWNLWAKHLKAGLENAPGKQISDQTALNHMIWTERPPVTLLPAIYNWMCHLAVPRFDSESWKFCEPGVEGKPLGAVHLTWKSKHLNIDLGPNGPRSLHYPGKRKQPGEPDGAASPPAF